MNSKMSLFPVYILVAIVTVTLFTSTIMLITICIWRVTVANKRRKDVDEELASSIGDNCIYDDIITIGPVYETINSNEESISVTNNKAYETNIIQGGNFVSSEIAVTNNEAYSSISLSRAVMSTESDEFNKKSVHFNSQSTTNSEDCISIGQ